MPASKKPRALVIHHLRPMVGDVATMALAKVGYDLDHRFPIDGDPLPTPGDGHALALMHGSLADVTKLDAPGIRAEHDWIEAWWKTERPFLGICHGLQLACQVLGARVGPPEHGQAEFGYYPLRSKAPELVPDGLHVFQWHYYGADLPDGAERLAGSDLYPNQIVRFGPRRLALQCHAELSLGDQSFLLRNDPDGLKRPGAQDPVTLATKGREHFQTMQAWMKGFVDTWLAEAMKSAYD